MKLDNPLLVRWEYAREERLERRNAVLRALSHGPSPEDASMAAVAALRPKRLLDVGCGLGELGERFRNELGVHVCAVDSSPRMVELSRARGLDAQLADVEQDFEGELVFRDTGTLRTFVASTGPFRAGTRHVIFVARGPR